MVLEATFSGVVYTAYVFRLHIMSNLQSCPPCAGLGVWGGGGGGRYKTDSLLIYVLKGVGISVYSVSNFA